MAFNKIFQIVNVLVSIPWMIMILAPKWRHTLFLIKNLIVPLILATAYTVLVVLNDPKPMDFSSIDALMILFSNEQILLTGWVHYLAFDLLVGSWMLLKMNRLEWSRMLIALCLLPTFILGPVGFLIFYVFHLIKHQSMITIETH